MQEFEDVVVMGGGVIGSSIAYFLLSSEQFDGTVTVIDIEPYSASSNWSGLRQQFSLPENIQMAQFAKEFLTGISGFLGSAENPINLNFRETGFLFLAADEDIAAMYGVNNLQKHYGVPVGLLDTDDLCRGYPWLNIEGLAGGSLGLSGEGVFDSGKLLSAYRKKAVTLGARYLSGRVVGMDIRNERVKSIELADGQRIFAGVFINAAGSDVKKISHLAEIEIAVIQRKRQVFSFSCKTEIKNCPFVTDPTGVTLQQQDRIFFSSWLPPVKHDQPKPDNKIDYAWFEGHIWPILSHRIPAFRNITMEGAATQYFDYNLLDQNPVIGPHPDLRNFFFATGFLDFSSQASPAVGRALAELVCFGEYHSLDLSRFSFSRMVTDEAILEHNVP
jgi:FAD-dependent oxidoreductase domain-containing protein 1